MMKNLRMRWKALAPEVYSKQFGTVSSKSDVYSYGMMVLLELVGARDKKINADTESSSQYFPQWISEHLDEYCISASKINGDGAYEKDDSGRSVVYTSDSNLSPNND
jgi:serine/threonine protein kinase